MFEFYMHFQHCARAPSFSLEKKRINNFPLFLGWKIWKTSNAACLDQKVWTEAVTQNNQQILAAHAYKPIPSMRYYSLVLWNSLLDTSWKRPTDMCGIGWSLFSKEDISHI